MINKKRLVNTFKKLVKLDSLSLKEGKVVMFLEKELDKLGSKHYQAGRPKDGEAGNLIVEVPGKGPTMLLNAHLDTVSPGEHIRLIEKKGCLYSNGKTVLGADNKAGVAALLEILRVLKERKIKHPNLLVIFTVAEEMGLRGARALPKKLLSADFGIALDGGDIDEIIYKAPSQNNFTATIYGKAAHAGIHPEKGINAITVASHAIARMKQGRIDRETTANIGVIKGGQATNIIPDRVELKGEARSHSLKKLGKQIKHMENILRRASARFGAGLDIKIEEVYHSFEVNPSARILKLAVGSLKKAGVQPVVKQTGGGSDANIFNAVGIPTIIMGVGADRVHTTEERIMVKDLVKGTEIVFNLIKNVGYGPACRQAGTRRYINLQRPIPVSDEQKGT